MINYFKKLSLSTMLNDSAFPNLLHYIFNFKFLNKTHGGVLPSHTRFLLLFLLVVSISVSAQRKQIPLSQSDSRFTITAEKYYSFVNDEEYFFYIQNNTNDKYQFIVNVTLRSSCHPTKNFNLHVNGIVTLLPRGRFTPNNDWVHSFLGGANAKDCRQKDGDGYTFLTGISYSYSKIVNLSEQERKKEEEELRRQEEETRKKEEAKKVVEAKKAEEERLRKRAEEEKSVKEKQDLEAQNNSSEQQRLQREEAERLRDQKEREKQFLEELETETAIMKQKEEEFAKLKTKINTGFSKSLQGKPQNSNDSYWRGAPGERSPTLNNDKAIVKSDNEKRLHYLKDSSGNIIKEYEYATYSYLEPIGKDGQYFKLGPPANTMMGTGYFSIIDKTGKQLIIDGEAKFSGMIPNDDGGYYLTIKQSASLHDADSDYSLRNDKFLYPTLSAAIQAQEQKIIQSKQKRSEERRNDPKGTVYFGANSRYNVYAAKTITTNEDLKFLMSDKGFIVIQ